MVSIETPLQARVPLRDTQYALALEALWWVPEKKGTHSGVPFKGILFYLGYKQCSPILGNSLVMVVQKF